MRLFSRSQGRSPSAASVLRNAVLEALETRQLLAVVPVISDQVPSDVTETSVTVRWEDASSDETGFRVEWGQHGDWYFNRTVAANTTATAITANIKPGNLYNFRVRANTAGGTFTDWSANGYRQSILNAPASLTASAVSGKQVDLAWSDVNGEAKYYIYRRLPGEQWSTTPLATVGTNVLNYSDKAAAEHTTYDYMVRSWNWGGVQSDGGPTASVTTMIGTAKAIDARALSGTSIYIGWQDGSVGERQPRREFAGRFRLGTGGRYVGRLRRLHHRRPAAFHRLPVPRHAPG